jgi:DNA-binding CsgD family transcriptional regulator
LPGRYVLVVSGFSGIMALETNAMTRPDQSDLMNVILVGKELLRSRTFIELKDALSNYVVRLFDASGCILTLMSGGRLDPKTSEFGGTCESDKKSEYYEEYYKIDPLLKAPYTPYPYRVYTTQDVVGDQALFEKTEYYRKFLKPMSIRSHLFFNLGNGTEFIGNFLLTRDAASPPFGAAEKGLAVLIEPILSAALENTLLIDQNLRHEFAISALLEKIPAKGIVILNGSLDLVHKNGNAEIILSMLYQPDEPRHKLPALVRSEIQWRVNEIMKGSLNGSVPSDLTSLGLSPFGTKRKIVVKVSPISGQMKRPHILLTLEMEHNQLFIAEQLDGHGLTHREIEIAASICQGMKNVDIAQRLCISEHTVSNHVRHIFEKLGINNRTGLFQYIVDLTK